jgi:amino acid transporter
MNEPRLQDIDCNLDTLLSEIPFEKTDKNYLKPVLSKITEPSKTIWGYKEMLFCIIVFSLISILIYFFLGYKSTGEVLKINIPNLEVQLLTLFTIILIIVLIIFTEKLYRLNKNKSSK